MKLRWKIAAGVGGGLAVVLYFGVVYPFWGMPFSGPRASGW